ncbi:MAG: VWA domain-containing protein [Vicinamibacteraceae bacterium]|nr:VWA domain-containing protein [Vicinamibacteraceae bacterium]
MDRTTGRPAAWIVAAALAGGGVVLAQQQVFRTGVEVVSLNVTVTNPGNAFLTDLTRDEFEVFEDGVRQEITFFTRSHTPISLALLLDTSASMDDKIATAQEAAVGFARRLRSEDNAMVVDFDSRVTVLQTFTNDVNALERSIRSTTPDGSTALFNAVYIALNELKKTRATSLDEVRRQAIVVLSDGEDTSSLLPFEEVLELAKRSETSIYAIGVRSKEPLQPRGFREAEFVLRQLARETGGRAFFPGSAAELPAIYTVIAEELASQYTMGYTSKNARRDGAWRRIVVRALRPNALARTKQGYYAPES